MCNSILHATHFSAIRGTEKLPHRENKVKQAELISLRHPLNRI